MINSRHFMNPLLLHRWLGQVDITDPLMGSRRRILLHYRPFRVGNEGESMNLSDVFLLKPFSVGCVEHIQYKETTKKTDLSSSKQTVPTVSLGLISVYHRGFRAKMAARVSWFDLWYPNCLGSSRLIMDNITSTFRILQHRRSRINVGALGVLIAVRCERVSCGVSFSQRHTVHRECSLLFSVRAA